MKTRKFLAETLGTSWLVFAGCGSAVLAASFPEFGIGFQGVSLAFGLSVLTMAYAIAPISGCHLNPAVTLGLSLAGKHPKNEIILYLLAQFLGAIIGAAFLYLIASGNLNFDLVHSGFAANGYADHSPGNYSLLSAIIAETLSTAFFIFIILSVTDKKAANGFAPLAIGLTLTLIHLITIPVTNTSVNPARSLAPAIFLGGWAIEQVWVFIVFPILGAAFGTLCYKVIVKD